jgi:hypothetical protein
MRRDHHLISIAFLANRGARLVEVLQYEMSCPDARYLDFRDDIASANTMDLMRKVEFPALPEKVTGLLRLGDGQAAHSRDGKRRIVINIRKAIKIALRQILGIAGKEILNGFSCVSNAPQVNSPFYLSTLLSVLDMYY